jgi:hypothetical protein
MVTLADQGPADTWTLAQSMDEWTDTYGDPISESSGSAAAECFFREGGAKLYTVRAVGVTPVKASASFDGASDATMTVTAKYPGAFYNRYRIDVTVDGGDFTVTVKDNVTGDVLEVSDAFSTVTEAVAWSANSDYITITDDVTASDNPVAATNVALTGGTDDRGTTTQTQYDTALDLFTPDLGPGQVFAPGISTSAMATSLSQHAADNNRFALWDLPNSTSKATLLTAASAVTDLADASRLMIIGGYQKIPALVAGVPRTVPRSGSVAGIIARNDIRFGNPNQAVAGDQGFSIGDSVFATDLVYKPTAADRQDLNEAGVNLGLYYYGAVRNYGFRTAAPKLTFPNHWMAGNVRLDMAIKAECQAEGERFVFSQIDGFGHTAAKFAGVLEAILLRYYQKGALYDNRAAGGVGGPSTAFTVDTGPGVNTPELVADGVLSAVIQVRRSPMAELVNIKIRVVSTREELVA